MAFAKLEQAQRIVVETAAYHVAEWASIPLFALVVGQIASAADDDMASPFLLGRDVIEDSDHGPCLRSELDLEEVLRKQF